MEPVEQISSRILLVRGQKVMLDADLAELYGTSTSRFNEQVRRNRDRFPSDFMFQLTNQEVERLRSQIAISTGKTREVGRGGRRYLPLAFTEHGAIMAATILNTPRATEVSVFVVRAFVRLREMVAANKELAKKLDELERRVSHHDEAITSIVKAIRELATPPEPKPKRRIGFISGE
ncbi:MAG: ORF6N domain-containing protein [Terriglobia bacterium]